MKLDSKKKRIIAIGAHGDDIELGCGGSIAKAAEQGDVVKMVLVTGTELKTNNNLSIRTSKQAQNEANEAATLLGIKDIEILGYEDTKVPYSVDLISELDEIINKFKPDIIFTHFVFDTHQDHINTAHSTISASRNQRSILLYEPINPSGQGYVAFRPQVYVDISSTINKKIDSLKAHKSQYSRYSDSWTRGVKARAAFRGFEMGVDYAECFEVVRFELNL